MGSTALANDLESATWGLANLMNVLEVRPTVVPLFETAMLDASAQLRREVLVQVKVNDLLC
jgi:hypothetical protein